MSADSLSGIAIIGMSGRFPGASSVQQLWENLKAGRESISHFTREELEARDPAALRGDSAYVRARGVLDGVDLFDASYFGISPREAELIDPQHRLFLECCVEALEDGSCDPARARGPIGVWAGQSLPTYMLANLADGRGFLDKVTGEYQVGSYPVVLGNDKDYLATRVSYKLDLSGPSMTVQCACSTSLVAVAQAAGALLGYQCDLALAGAASITFPQKRGYLQQEGGMVSPDGKCRAFDAAAAGTIFSSGVGVVLLKRLEDAIEDRDRIYAVIRGVAVNNDGARKAGYMAPSPERQAEAIAMAQELAGVAADSIGYVETHGTGTPLGDPIEFEGLTRAFRARGAQGTGYCALASLKGNIGHLEVAAGVTGLIKAALAVREGVIPPSLHFEKPNPRIQLEGSPFYVNTELRKWPEALTPRRAGVSAFGVGGTNAHVVLEEPPPVVVPGLAWPAQVLLLSARSESALDATSLLLADHLRTQPTLPLADVAFALQVGRRSLAHRRAVVARDTGSAIAALTGQSGPRAFFKDSYETAPQVTFLFPGQGAQHPAMGAALYAHEPAFRAEVDLCCALLAPHLGFDLRTLLFRSDAPADAAERLTRTEVTQPALFVLEYALARLWISWRIHPTRLIGHSVGEYVGACLAGVIELPDALRLVAARGRLIQALPGGAMLSVRLPEAEALRRLTPDLSLAAVNSNALCVIAGPEDAITGLEVRLTSEQVVYRRLRTSHAFHSAMMDAALAPFAEEVRKTRLSPPKLEVVSTVTGEKMTAAQAQDSLYWTRHMREPVRFAAAVQTALREPGTVLLEVGPGRALATLSKQLGGEEPRAVLSSLGDADEAGGSGELWQMQQALGGLWVAGAAADFQAVHAGRGRSRVGLPTYPFERKRHFIDPAPRDEFAAAGGPTLKPVPQPLPKGESEDIAAVLRAQLGLMQQQLSMLERLGEPQGDGCTAEATVVRRN